MKYGRLILNNILRNKRRSILTVTSIAVSLFLVATLRTLLTELESPPSTPDSALRLITRHKVSLATILPVSHRTVIERVEGVDAVMGSMWFGGIYKDPKNFFAQFAVDADRLFVVYPDMAVPQAQKDAFLRDRAGAIAGNNLAERFGWRIGERITLQGTIFGFDPELTLRAIYRGGGDDGGSLYFHWSYFNEGIRSLFSGPNLDFVGMFSIRASSAEAVPETAGRIDSLFKNSSAPTKTESEKAFVLGFLSMMGNVRLLITSISSVVIFTVVLVASNSMAMSIRERVREIGVLKALGFSRGQVLALLLTESLSLAMLGALAGGIGARVIFSNINIAAIAGGFIQRFLVTPGTMALCLGLGILVGILSAGIPAWRAANRPVVDALRA